MLTHRCGPSSNERLGSDSAGLPIKNLPAGITTISGHSAQSLNTSPGLRGNSGGSLGGAGAAGNVTEGAEETDGGETAGIVGVTGISGFTVMSATKGNDAVKWCATHMNLKLPPDQLETRQGRDAMLNVVRTLFANNGYHIQFNVLDTEKLRDAQKHPENYRDLVVRVAGFSAFFTQLHVGVQNEVIVRTLQRC